MSIQPGQHAKHLTAFLFGLGLLLAVTLILAGQTATPTSGTGEGPEMRLVITDPPGACVDTQCQVGTGETFKLGVEIVRAPEEIRENDVVVQTPGYILFQSSVSYGGAITYDFSRPAIDEILWPACAPATALKSQFDQLQATDELVSHGCLSGILSPLPSEFLGIAVELVMVCSQQDSNNTIEMLPYADEPSNAAPTGTLGSGFATVNDPATVIVPKMTGLDMFCGTPPTPTITPTITPGGPTPTPTPTATPTPTLTPTATPVPVTPTATFVSTLPCGDVNGDRLVNAEDALWVLWFSSNLITSLPHPGDVSGDGVVDPLDALFIHWIELNLFICL